MLHRRSADLEMSCSPKRPQSVGGLLHVAYWPILLQKSVETDREP